MSPFGLEKLGQQQEGGVESEGLKMLNESEQKLRDEAGSVEDPEVRRRVETVATVLAEITEQTARAEKK